MSRLVFRYTACHQASTWTGHDGEGLKGIGTRVSELQKHLSKATLQMKMVLVDMTAYHRKKQVKLASLYRTCFAIHRHSVIAC